MPTSRGTVASGRRISIFSKKKHPLLWPSASRDRDRPSPSPNLSRRARLCSNNILHHVRARHVDEFESVSFFLSPPPRRMYVSACDMTKCERVNNDRGKSADRKARAKNRSAARITNTHYVTQSSVQRKEVEWMRETTLEWDLQRGAFLFCVCEKKKTAISSEKHNIIRMLRSAIREETKHFQNAHTLLRSPNITKFNGYDNIITNNITRLNRWYFYTVWLLVWRRA